MIEPYSNNLITPLVKIGVIYSDNIVFVNTLTFTYAIDLQSFNTDESKNSKVCNIGTYKIDGDIVNTINNYDGRIAIYEIDLIENNIRLCFLPKRNEWDDYNSFWLIFAQGKTSLFASEYSYFNIVDFWDTAGYYIPTQTTELSKKDFIELHPQYIKYMNDNKIDLMHNEI